MRVDGHKYRKRGLCPPVMVDLTLELCIGQEAVRTREIMRVCDEEHQQRGGADTPASSLRSSFNKACADLRSVSALEDAGHGYRHVNGWAYCEDIHEGIRNARPKPATDSGARRYYLKIEVFEKQKCRCARCGQHFDRVEDLKVDHITPRDAGGSDGQENLQLLCLPIDSAKGNRIEHM